MSDNETRPPVKPQKEQLHSKDYRVIYSNNFTLSMSNNDANITFSNDTTIKNKIFTEATVFFSPSLMKLLHHSLGLAISTYERREGPIKVPPARLEALDKVFADQEAVRTKKSSTDGVDSGG